MLGLEINGGWIREFEECIAEVLDAYENLQEQHTELQAFDQKECSKCLQEKSNYSFCGNIFLQDLRWRAHASTPVNVTLKHLMNLLTSKVLFPAVQQGGSMNLLSSRQLADKQGAVPCCPARCVDEPAVQQATC